MIKTLGAIGGATALLTLAAPALAQSVAPSEAGETRTPATPIVTAYPAAADGDGATTNGFNVSRWAEDWRGLRDPAKREDVFDRLKFLPLAADGAVYLTLSGELRLRVNHTTNPNLRETRAQRQDINRIIGGADLHVGPHVRAVAEIAHGGIAGVALGTPAANLRNDLVLPQAFVEGNVDVAGVALGARYGRQEFGDGSNLLVSQRDNNTIHYTLNGIRAWARGHRVRADLFDLKPTRYGVRGTGDDVSDAAQRFSGVTLGFAAPTSLFGGSKIYVDPFFWRWRDAAGGWGVRTGPTTRYYLGTRVWGDAGPVTVDWTVSRQYGRYRDQDIDAWQVFLAQTYRLGQAKNAPRIGVHVDYATGGGGYGDGKLRDADSPFGNSIYFSYGLFLTPSNYIAVAPNVTLSPLKAVRLTAEYQLAWRDSTSDAVYRANGQPFAGTQLIRNAKVADIARLQAIWSITPRLSFTGRYEHLAAGPSLTQAGYTDSDFLAGWLSFRF